MSFFQLNPEYRLDEGLFLSHSSRQVLNSCEKRLEFRKFYSHAYKQTIAADDDINLGSGTAMHVAWQSWLLHQDKQKAAWELLRHYPHKQSKSIMQTKSVEACFLTMEELYQHPFESRYSIAWVKVNGETRPAIEVPFQITLKGINLAPADSGLHIPVHYIGNIDVIFWDALMECFVVCDLKTTRKLLNDYTIKYQFDEQCLPYGYIIELVTQKLVTSFEVIYMVAYIDALKPFARPYSFMKTQESVQEWAKSFIMDIRRLQSMFATNHFPRRGNACMGYQACEYADVCTYTDASGIRNWLSLAFPGDYQRSRPEPWFRIELQMEGSNVVN